jgi:hypothetical protein
MPSPLANLGVGGVERVSYCGHQHRTASLMCSARDFSRIAQHASAIGVRLKVDDALKSAAPLL